MAWEFQFGDALTRKNNIWRRSLSLMKIGKCVVL